MRSVAPRVCDGDTVLAVANGLAGAASGARRACKSRRAAHQRFQRTAIGRPQRAQAR